MFSSIFHRDFVFYCMIFFTKVTDFHCLCVYAVLHNTTVSVLITISVVIFLMILQTICLILISFLTFRSLYAFQCHLCLYMYTCCSVSLFVWVSSVNVVMFLLCLLTSLSLVSHSFSTFSFLGWWDCTVSLFRCVVSVCQVFCSLTITWYYRVVFLWINRTEITTTSRR